MKVAFIFPPPWDPKCPSYAMALFRASTINAHHEFIGIDLNVDLYRAVSAEDQCLWDGRHAIRWTEENSQIIQKYSGYLDSCVDAMLKQNIDLFAFHANCFSKYVALHIAEKIKDVRPKAGVIFGGPQCFPAYEGVDLLKSKQVDAICTGEGDYVWPAILDAFASTGKLHLDLAGIAYRNDAGEIVDGGPPELVDDLNGLPAADYEGVEFAKYDNPNYTVSTMSSRGCINTCAFCSERPNFIRYRYREGENILQEIRGHLAAFNNYSKSKSKGIVSRRELSGAVASLRSKIWRAIKDGTILRKSLSFLWRRISKPLGREVIPHIHFSDSLINGAPKELEKFCDLTIESGLKFSWSGMALLRKEMTISLLTKMKQAGCNFISWGMESGCQRVLDMMRKRFFTMPLAEEIIRNTYAVGIQQGAALIVGFPGETEEMFMETVRFIRDYKKYFEDVGVQPMYIVRNSQVYNQHEEFGVDQRNADEGIRWQSVDGTNTYDIRLKRIAVLESILSKKIIITDK